MNCKELVNEFSKAQATGPRRWFVAIFHLLCCSGCRNYLAHLRLLRKAARERSPEPSQGEVAQVVEASLVAIRAKSD
jgi:hypothetical protein